ncbi:MAG TPA: TetR family transcriptional regulator [Solirubrobacteraceae bacterium]|nr:TetR family transcriptional regulator [Solirubrobacteraceae bacterium]
MTTFQRARSAEQREARREAILAEAAAMLDELPVREVTLNELSRRVGLAKSNVLRYFESREAILLELLDRAWRGWLAALPAQLADDAGRAAPVRARVERVAAALAGSLAAQPVLCELLAARGGTLEHNVSADLAALHRNKALANAIFLADLLRRPLPELGADAERLATLLTLLVPAAWTHSQPAASVLAAYRADPQLAARHTDFAPALQDLLTTSGLGLLARRAA